MQLAARSIGRPMRYFLAKREAGPMLIVAERMDEIHDHLKKLGLDNQFHPSYTRMVPAHYVVRVDVIGCPDPNPTYKRFFEPEQGTMNADLDSIGEAYIGALKTECLKWLKQIPEKEPVGVLFSGGIDSGSVFLVLYHCMLEMGMSPQRLKAFTLSVNGGADAGQAHDFLNQMDLSLFLETIEVAESEIDYREAIKTIEDYKALDVEAATMALTLCKHIRKRYPDWKYLADGDGGDENLKAYPIEENPELTIRSVLNNPLLYHEGWGVDKIKHSLTYSGGQSRGHVRTYAPARKLLDNGLPVALGTDYNPGSTPSGNFIQLTDWDHHQLYALKGEIVKRGVKAITGIEMPVYEKRRFQHGAVPDTDFNNLFADNEIEYRMFFASLYA